MGIALGVIVWVPSLLFAVESEAALALVWLPAVLAAVVGASFGVRSRARVLVAVGLPAGTPAVGNLVVLATWARVEAFGAALVLVWTGLAAGAAAATGAIRLVRVQ